jgi:hypothetical protein
LNPKHRGGQNVNFPRFNFLQIARGDVGSFRQFFLRQTLVHPFPAHTRAKVLESLPLFSGNSHAILHRYNGRNMNDTYIVKKLQVLTCKTMSNHYNPNRLDSELK